MKKSLNLRFPNSLEKDIKKDEIIVIGVCLIFSEIEKNIIYLLYIIYDLKKFK